MLGNRYVMGIVGILLIMVIAYNVQFFRSRQKTDRTENALQPFTPQGVQKHSGSPPQERTSVRQSDRSLPAAAAQPLAKEDKVIWKRDPFSLRAGEDRKPAVITYDIKLMGIIKRDGDSHALINGKVYRVNDRIDKAVIREIKQHSIVILADGKKQEISFDDYKVIKEKMK